MNERGIMNLSELKRPTETITPCHNCLTTVDICSHKTEYTSPEYHGDNGFSYSVTIKLCALCIEKFLKANKVF